MKLSDVFQKGAARSAQVSPCSFAGTALRDSIAARHRAQLISKLAWNRSVNHGETQRRGVATNQGGTPPEHRLCNLETGRANSSRAGALRLPGSLICIARLSSWRINQLRRGFFKLRRGACAYQQLQLANALSNSSSVHGENLLQEGIAREEEPGAKAKLLGSRFRIARLAGR